MARRLSLLAVALALAALLSLLPRPDARAELLAPGEYRGWVVEDRWDGLHLANGVYLLPIATPAADRARPFVGKPVRVDVTKIDRTLGFDWTIHGIGSIAETRPAHPGLEVSIVPGTDRLRPGEKQRLAIWIRYEGKGPLTFRARHLGVQVRRRGAPLGKAWPPVPGKDDDGTAWLTGGSSMTAIEANVRHENSAVRKAPGGVFTAEGPFRYETSLTIPLPAGEYEAWASSGDLNYSRAPDARSAMVRFDVTE